VRLRPLVLVVDDSAAQRYIYARALQRARIRVAYAGNAHVAEKLARRLRPDLMLIDVLMPITDGETLARRLKADANTSWIPLVLMTIDAHLVPSTATQAQGFVRKSRDLQAEMSVVLEALAL